MEYKTPALLSHLDRATSTLESFVHYCGCDPAHLHPRLPDLGQAHTAGLDMLNRAGVQQRHHHCHYQPGGRCRSKGMPAQSPDGMVIAERPSGRALFITAGFDFGCPSNSISGS